MRIVGARHGQRANGVGQAVVCLVGDGLAIGLLVQAGLETAALDHEVVDDAVEDGVVVESAFGVFEEIPRGFRSLVKLQLDLDITVIRLENYHHIPARLGAARASYEKDMEQL